MNGDREQKDEYDFLGVSVERISSPELEAAGIRIFRPLPPKKAELADVRSDHLKDDKPEDHES
jgi:hypothetical protein